MGESAQLAMDRLLAYCNEPPSRTWSADGGRNFARVYIKDGRHREIGYGYGPTLTEAIDRALEGLVPDPGEKTVTADDVFERCVEKAADVLRGYIHNPRRVTADALDAAGVPAMVEALAFYADPANWVPVRRGDALVQAATRDDHGQRARAVLGGEVQERSDRSELEAEVASLKTEYHAAATLLRQRTEDLDALREWCKQQGHLPADLPSPSSFDRELRKRLGTNDRGDES